MSCSAELSMKRIKTLGQLCTPAGLSAPLFALLIEDSLQNMKPFTSLDYSCVDWFVSDLGLVVQSNINLTTLLRHQLVKYMPTTLSNPLLYFVEKM